MDSGYLESDTEAKIQFSILMTWSTITMFICMPIFALIIDRIGMHIFILIAFFGRMVTLFTFFFFAEVPD